ncbi:N-acetyltransferase [Weissella coleopterorum]|uniref:N-acetyltransferase n=1 Tax=Weissella coleopterorum TaxID=2714949 RepID=A0A6G8B1E2_9LACO|nr:GNAT family N-acetyltransferase [Weissella coleopterorum]QIL51128.1 N-acetyltransferase [Weissella coleopterorum]
MEFEIEPGRLLHRNEQGEIDAELIFSVIEDGRVWSIDSTNVAVQLRGQGVAGAMLTQLFEMAQQEHKLLRPVCSYAKKKFFVTPEYQKIEWHDGMPLV